MCFCVSTNDQQQVIFNRDLRNHVYYAFGQAASSEIKRGRHCSLALDENMNILAKYVNKGREHAESGVSKILNKKGIKAHLVLVVRTTLTGEMRISKPCDNCYAAMRDAKVKHCMYSTGHFQFKSELL